MKGYAEQARHDPSLIFEFARNARTHTMYSIDNRDRLTELADVLQCDVGAPMPAILAMEHDVILTYFLRGNVPPQAQLTATRSSGSVERPNAASIRFKHCRAHMFGPPNDEALQGHTLWSRGLKPYAAFEVKSSSWIRGLERMNSVHPHHDPRSFAGESHYIFTFHDTTFECVARGYSSRIGTNWDRELMGYQFESVLGLGLSEQ